jgi:pimeloyl-ACP methyl ester carboxylesterase
LAPDSAGQGFTEMVELDGGSPHGPLARHLQDFLDAVEPGPVTIVGSSYGAQLAVLVALARPRQVQGLVLVSSGSLVLDDQRLLAALARTRSEGEAMFAPPGPTSASTRSWMSRFFDDPGAVPDELVDAYLASAGDPRVGRFYLDAVAGMADLEASRPYRVGDRLGDLTMPVRLAWGRRDPMSRVADAKSLLVGLRHGDMVVFDHSAHVPYLEEPDAFAEVVESFARMGRTREATPE